MDSELLLVIAVIMGATMAAFAIALIILAGLIYKVAKLYAPPPTQTRRVPRFGTTDDGLDPPVLAGLNGYPKRDATDDDEPGNVAERSTVTQVAVAAEGMIAHDRDQWYEEMREEGYEDDEIARMEQSGVVPVFEEGS